MIEADEAINGFYERLTFLGVIVGDVAEIIIYLIDIKVES